MKQMDWSETDLRGKRSAAYSVWAMGSTALQAHYQISQAAFWRRHWAKQPGLLIFFKIQSRITPILGPK